MPLRRPLLLFAKGLLFACLFGGWAFGYHLLALGACWECSLQAGVLYGLSAVVFFPLLVLFLSRVRGLRRPSLRRALLFGVVWGLVMGLVVFALMGSPWRIGAVLVSWIIFWLVFPLLVGPLPIL